MEILPTWDTLEAKAAEKGWTNERRLAAPFRAKERTFPGSAPAVPGEGPMVLWRDTFDWCPFCVPTQLLLEEKRIPYLTKKVPLSNYSAPAGEKVPGNVGTSLVPDLTLDFQGPNERTIIADHGHDLLNW